MGKVHAYNPNTGGGDSDRAETNDPWGLLAFTLAKWLSSEFSENREKLRQSPECAVNLGPSLPGAHNTPVHTCTCELLWLGGMNHQQTTCLICARTWVESMAQKRIFFFSHIYKYL